jgi:hypothetical protein
VSGWGEGSGVFSPGEKATSSPLKAAAAVLTAPVEFFYMLRFNETGTGKQLKDWCFSFLLSFSSCNTSGLG